MKKQLIFLFAALMLSLSSYAQVTTAQVQGVILDDSEMGLFGANVVAEHLPTGSTYGTNTLDNGRYNIPNLRVGGPYKITISFVGFETQTMDNVFLNVGDKLKLNFTLKGAATELATIEIKATAGGIFQSDRTGASTNISKNQIKTMPTISRSTADLTRLTPSSDGHSFGGRNNQMNNFTLDGSIFNNPYGLDAATPGGQTNAQPVSLDAIDQIQVDIAPYDVTKAGFTGASVNAVTKSGTNEFHGTVFGFYRNQDLTGGKVKGENVFKGDLKHLQAGFSLGGPIIKDKLFFFANAEMEDRSDLGSNFLAKRSGLTGDRVSRVEAADLDLVSQTLKNRFGYETGAYENYIHDTKNVKALVKLDWNINDIHTLSATYNFLDASLGKPAHPEAIGRRGPDQTTLQFFNSGYTINNVLHSGIVELKSNFSNKFSNNLQAGITKFSDSRDPFSTPFPVLNINKDGSRYIVAGHEPFSIHNVLDQKVYQVTDNFNIYSGNHTYTIGTSFEKFEFGNSFNLGVNEPYGVPYAGGTFGPGFASVTDFVNFVNSGGMDPIVQHAKDVNAAGGFPFSYTNVGQWALYIQDEWAVNDKFTLTYGIRMDKPLYFDTSDQAKAVQDRAFDYDPTITYYDENGRGLTFDHSHMPSGTPLFSPRVGFNYDVKGDKTQQFRGGTGLFSGRFPFVWIGNQVSSPNWWFYQMTAYDFKFPQVWRTNLGYDRKLNNGWSSSVDVVYTKDINAMMVRNYGLNTPTGTLQGAGGDNRVIYNPATDRANFTGFGFPIPVDAYVFTNDDKGYTFNTSFQVFKTWNNNATASLAYDYLVSKDASSIPAEISSDAFARNPAIGNVNQAVESHSRFGHNHRFVGSFNKRFDYGNGKYATSVGMFMEYVKGGRYSYTYAGDINNDGSNLNDLIFIPTANQINAMVFTGTQTEQSAQRVALENFIKQDDYLSSRRGDYAGKYATTLPWRSNWDMKILQDFFLNTQKSKSIQLSIDILNVGNFINSDWGVRKNPTNTQPIGVTVDSSGYPTYSFDTNLKSTYTNDFSLLSRWQMQFGLRYIF
ncbi:MAG: carboxypeptidase regulatory-like domain-containing protein [Flavobacteriaceae bacterium]|nr:carboxypeptidase regulatory-like domain-containing protein [Flavobacteriaceae bacterium]